MKRSRAQSVSEYSICVVIILLAVLTIQVYVKRGLQGRYADITDFTTTSLQARVAEETGVSHLVPRQYEPYYQKEDIGSSQNLTANVVRKTQGEINRTIVKDSLTRQGKITDLINYDADK